MSLEPKTEGTSLLLLGLLVFSPLQTALQVMLRKPYVDLHATIVQVAAYQQSTRYAVEQDGL
jgi:hypothetical protein